MKKNSGVTLISLIITIITFLIIISITVDYGVSTLHEATNEKLEAELSLVQEAVIQRYSLVKTLKEDGKFPNNLSYNGSITLANDPDRPKLLVGSRINKVEDLDSNEFTTRLIDYTDKSKLTYEQFYYLLSQSDLENLGIEKSDTDQTGASQSTNRSYIVNYFTGEVYDVVNRKYYATDANPTPDSVYLEGTSGSNEVTNYNFSDD